MTGSLPRGRISGGQEGRTSQHPPHAASRLRVPRGPIQHAPHVPRAPSSALGSTSALLLRSSLTCLPVAVLPLHHFTFPRGFPGTSKARWFHELPCARRTMAQPSTALDLCGFLAAAVRQCHAAWAAARDGGLVATQMVSKSNSSLPSAPGVWAP